MIRLEDIRHADHSTLIIKNCTFTTFRDRGDLIQSVSIRWYCSCGHPSEEEHDRDIGLPRGAPWP